MRLEFDLRSLEDLGDAGIAVLLEQKKRFLCQLSWGDAIEFGEGMPFREDGEEFISLDFSNLKGGVCGKGKKSAVDAALHECLFDFGVVAQEELVVHSGIVALECTDDVGEPMRCDARERSDADDARSQAAHFVDLHAELVLRGHDGSGGWEKLRSFGCKHDTRTRSIEQLHAPFRFKFGNHAADLRLRVGERIGCAGEAPEFGG